MDITTGVILGWKSATARSERSHLRGSFSGGDKDGLSIIPSHRGKEERR